MAFLPFGGVKPTYSRTLARWPSRPVFVGDNSPSGDHPAGSAVFFFFSLLGEPTAAWAAREAEAAATRVRERAGQRAQQVKRTWLARKFGGLKSDALRMLLVSLQLTAVAQLWPSVGMACAPNDPLTASQMAYGATSHTDEAAPSYSVQIDGLSDGETQLLLQQYETSNVLMQLLAQSPSALPVSLPPPPSAAASLSALPSPPPPSPPSPPRHVQSAHLGDDRRTRPPELREVGPQRLEPPCQRAYAPSFRSEFRPRTPKWSRFPHAAFSPPPPRQAQHITYRTMTGRESTVVLSASNRTVLDLLGYVATSAGIDNASLLTCVARRLDVEHAEAVCPTTPLCHMNLSATITILPQLSGAGKLKPLPKTPVGKASSLMAFGITKSQEPPPPTMRHYPRWYPTQSTTMVRPTQHRLDEAIRDCANSAKSPPQSKPKPKSGRGRPRGSCDSKECPRQRKKAKTQAAKVAVKQASAADAVIASPVAVTATLANPAVASAVAAALACEGVASAIVHALAADAVTMVTSLTLSTRAVGEAVASATTAGQTTPSAVHAMAVAAIITAALTTEIVQSAIPNALSAPAVVDAVSTALSAEAISSAVSKAIVAPAVATAVAAALRAEAISSAVSRAIASPSVATAVAAAVHQPSIARTILATPAVALAITSGLTSAVVSAFIVTGNFEATIEPPVLAAALSDPAMTATVNHALVVALSSPVIASVVASAPSVAAAIAAAISAISSPASTSQSQPASSSRHSHPGVKHKTHANKGSKRPVRAADASSPGDLEQQRATNWPSRYAGAPSQSHSFSTSTKPVSTSCRPAAHHGWRGRKMTTLLSAPGRGGKRRRKCRDSKTSDRPLPRLA